MMEYCVHLSFLYLLCLKNVYFVLMLYPLVVYVILVYFMEVVLFYCYTLIMIWLFATIIRGGNDLSNISEVRFCFYFVLAVRPMNITWFFRQRYLLHWQSLLFGAFICFKMDLFCWCILRLLPLVMNVLSEGRMTTAFFRNAGYIRL